MPSVKSRIEGYLRWAGRELASGAGRAAGRFPGGLTVVQGSPAADLDSLVGSAVYAFLLREERLAARSAAGEAPPQALIVPCMTIRKEDLRLRPAVPALFKRVGVLAEALIDRDAVDFGSCPVERVSIVLVDTDGRELPPGIRQRVVEIVDHHEASGERPRAAREILAPVGSVCTLVTEQILLRLPSLLDRGLAVLLLGTVLLDTVNLDPEAGRVTDRDRQAVARLREIAGAAARGLYEELRAARTRLEGLSSCDLLRRDYKQGEAGGLRYGMASVPLPSGEWAERGDPAACLGETVVRQRLDLLAVLFHYEVAGGRSFRRELLLWVRGTALYRDLREHLDSLSLNLRALAEPRLAFVQAGGGDEGRVEGAGGEDRRRNGGRGAGSPARWVGGLFAQGQSGFSRKRLEPALRRFLESRSREAE